MDELEVVWAYRPDDRSKQGKSERLPADLARMKVAEGLAVWPKAKPEPEAKASTAKVPKQQTPSAS